MQGYRDDVRDRYMQNTHVPDLNSSSTDPLPLPFDDRQTHLPHSHIDDTRSEQEHNFEWGSPVPVTASTATDEAIQQELLETERKVSLRRAGQDFLDRAMHTASKGDGADPFQTAIQPSTGGRQHGSAHKRRRAKPGAAEDPDVIAFGIMYEASKLYVYMGMYVVCHAVGLVLMKVGMCL